jgi:hypothetical protein
MIRHINIILKHKYEVFKLMAKCGMPIRGLMHDMSKFNPIEFFESVKYFQGYRSPIDAAKEDKGYSLAWFHHRGINKHHSQYWCDITWGEIKPADMPNVYLIEMVCDCVAAGKIYLGNKWTNSSPLEYYKSNQSKSFMSELTKKRLRTIYTQIKALGLDYFCFIVKTIGVNSFIDSVDKYLI